MVGAELTITADDQTFSAHLAMLSGLDQRVITAWTVAETSGGTSGVRGFNFLNVGNTDTNPYGGPRWATPAQAAEGTYTWLLQNPASGRGILASAGKSPDQQLSAIAASPFASSHYRDSSGKVGGNLVRAYNGLTLGGRIGELVVPAPVGGAAQSAGSAALAPVKAVTNPIKDVGSFFSFLGSGTFRYGAAFVVLLVLAFVIYFRKPILKGTALAAVA